MQLSWAGYSTFIGFVLLLTIAPGPDFAVVMKNALAAGRTAGLWTTVGINISNAAQGTVAALGLGAVIVASRPVFETIRWAGIVYLCWLGFHTLRSARRGPPGGAPDAPSPPSTGSWRRRLLQGALSNSTNPKILVFYRAFRTSRVLFAPPAAGGSRAVSGWCRWWWGRRAVGGPVGAAG
jgi:threonine/homoserine/homoserine lactone efflux protein